MSRWRSIGGIRADSALGASVLRLFLHVDNMPPDDFVIIHESPLPPPIQMNPYSMDPLVKAFMKQIQNSRRNHGC